MKMWSFTVQIPGPWPNSLDLVLFSDLVLTQSAFGVVFRMARMFLLDFWLVVGRARMSRTYCALRIFLVKQNVSVFAGFLAGRQLHIM